MKFHMNIRMNNQFIPLIGTGGTNGKFAQNAVHVYPTAINTVPIADTSLNRRNDVQRADKK